MAVIPTGLFVSPAKIKANTVAEFIAYAKDSPGKVTAATQGNGSTSHLTSEWFQMAAGVKFVQVPYRGSAPALQGMVAGDVDLFFDNLGVSLNLAKESKLKLLAVGTEQRMSSLPTTPTLAESLPGFMSSSWVAPSCHPRHRKRLPTSSAPTSPKRRRQCARGGAHPQPRGETRMKRALGRLALHMSYVDRSPPVWGCGPRPAPDLVSDRPWEQAAL